MPATERAYLRYNEEWQSPGSLDWNRKQALNLDDHAQIERLDSGNMLGHIDGLPEQLLAAWKHALDLPLPESGGVSNIVILGMGGSAIGGSLLRSLLAAECPAPILSNRDYELPAFVGPDTLVIASSYSGNTEETLATLAAAQQRDAQIVSISSGGKIAELTAESGGLAWRFDYESPPRAALGYSLLLPLRLLCRLGLLRDFSADVEEAAQVLRQQQARLDSQSPVSSNPAKRLAGQMLDRMVLIFAADPLTPVARRWRGQIAENGKAWAQFEQLPEMNHNAVVGLEHPEVLIDRTFALFLESSLAHPRNQRRAELTRRMFIGAGFNSDTVHTRGESRLAQMLSALHFGDYVSFYLAIAYGVDPSPVQPITWLKEQLA